MNSAELEKLISKCLVDFYSKRFDKLSSLRLKQILKRKNPYLFRAFGHEKASDVVEQILAAYISSSDETYFGDLFFEPIARVVAGAKVSDAPGVDFVIETDTEYKAFSVKSGPYPYNSRQKVKQSEDFKSLNSRLMKIHKHFDPILAHAYGTIDGQNPKLFYRDLSGQKFWTSITGDPIFHIKLIQLMKDAPAKHRPEYLIKWGAAINKFTAQFIKDFCFADGRIDWDKLVNFVSVEQEK